MDKRRKTREMKSLENGLLGDSDEDEDYYDSEEFE